MLSFMLPGQISAAADAISVFIISTSLGIRVGRQTDFRESDYWMTFTISKSFCVFSLRSKRKAKDPYWNELDAFLEEKKTKRELRVGNTKLRKQDKEKVPYWSNKVNRASIFRSA